MRCELDTFRTFLSTPFARMSATMRNGIWLPNDVESVSHRKRRYEHGSRNVLPSRQDRGLLPKVRTYVLYPLLHA